jgi:uncharacterized membrane protein
MRLESKCLAEVPLFAGLDCQTRRELEHVLTTGSFLVGHVLCRRGDPADCMFFIRSGRVAFSLDSDTGETISLRDAGPGEYFGEIGLFDGGSRTADITVLEDTDVEILKRADLLALIERQPRVAIELLAAISRRLRMASELLRKPVCRNANEALEARMSFSDRVADRVASFGGSWAFISCFGATLLFWMVLNGYLISQRPFDPYPFILLNLVLSTLAAIQAPVIMMSQNRQAAKDRLKADLDYEVNVKAEQEIAHLHSKVDRLYEEMQAHFVRLEAVNHEQPAHNGATLSDVTA